MRDGPNLYTYAQSNPVGYWDPDGLMSEPTGPPKGGPPIPTPPSKDGTPNEWVRVPGSEERPDKYKPKHPTPTPGDKGSQPGASYDPKSEHWDVDHGDRTRSRWKPAGTPDDEHDPRRPFKLPWWLPRLPSIPIVINPCLIDPFGPACKPSCGGPT
jgi:hypothetical protein